MKRRKHKIKDLQDKKLNKDKQKYPKRKNTKVIIYEQSKNLRTSK